MLPFQRPPRRPPFYRPPIHGPQQNSFLNSFKTPEGQWDLDKISKSVGQVNKLYGQINPLIKQMSSFFKK